MFIKGLTKEEVKNQIKLFTFETLRGSQPASSGFPRLIWGKTYQIRLHTFKALRFFIYFGFFSRISRSNYFFSWDFPKIKSFNQNSRKKLTKISFQELCPRKIFFVFSGRKKFEWRKNFISLEQSFLEASRLPTSILRPMLTFFISYVQFLVLQK